MPGVAEQPARRFRPGILVHPISTVDCADCGRMIHEHEWRWWESSTAVYVCRDCWEGQGVSEIDSWEHVLRMQPGDVALDRTEESGVRILIMRGYGALCAYVGVPDGHPLAGFKTSDLPISCHGSLNFSSGERAPQMEYPPGWYFYGWTYDHGGDYRTEYDVLPCPSDADGKRWTVKAVERDMAGTVIDFEQLARLAEGVAMKALGWRRAMEGKG